MNFTSLMTEVRQRRVRHELSTEFQLVDSVVVGHQWTGWVLGISGQDGCGHQWTGGHWASMERVDVGHGAGVSLEVDK